MCADYSLKEQKEFYEWVNTTKESIKNLDISSELEKDLCESLNNIKKSYQKCKIRFLNRKIASIRGKNRLEETLNIMKEKYNTTEELEKSFEKQRKYN